MDQSLLGNIENGRRLPTEAQTKRLADYFAVDPEQLEAVRIAEDMRRRYSNFDALKRAGNLLAAEEPAAYVVNKMGTTRAQPQNRKE